MPFVYNVGLSAANVSVSTSGSANTELPSMALRQATRGFDVLQALVMGRSGALTTLSSIAFKVRRWTTVGTGGQAVTPAAKRLGTTAATGAVSGETAITQGTVLGAQQIAFGCSAAGPGGFVARDADSAIHVEAGSADELAFNSLSPVVSLPHDINIDIAE